MTNFHAVPPSFRVANLAASVDGNVLRLGSDQKEGVPLGPWRDMRGTLWHPKTDGGWERG